MDKLTVNFIAIALIAVFLFSCNNKKKKEQQKETKIELCQGKYYTEAEASQET